MSIVDDIGFPAPRQSGCPFDPPPAYRRAATRLTGLDGSPCWLLTDYQDVRTALSDHRFSADVRTPGFPVLTRSQQELRIETPSLLRLDDPEHARLRRMLTGDFMIKKVETLRPEIQRITDSLLDQMTDGRSSADLVAEFALPLPSLVICLLLGVPYEEHDFFQERSRILLRRDSAPELVRTAQNELAEYLTKLTEAKRTAPDDGILSRLIARGELTTDEIATTARLLLIAGHETTANMTALSILALLRNPEQLALLRDHPEQAPRAVEELLRYLTIVHSGLSRVVAEDVTLGGVQMRAYDGVLLLLNTANRDEREFPAYDDLDLTRDARRHLAFGFGVHQCLGQPLARLELQVALTSILSRLPGLRLAVPFEELRFRHEMLIYGLHELPLAW